MQTSPASRNRKSQKSAKGQNKLQTTAAHAFWLLAPSREPCDITRSPCFSAPTPRGWPRLAGRSRASEFLCLESDLKSGDEGRVCLSWSRWLDRGTFVTPEPGERLEKPHWTLVCSVRSGRRPSGGARRASSCNALGTGQPRVRSHLDPWESK